jgi:tRNA-specific 2-thiouridylase
MSSEFKKERVVVAMSGGVDSSVAAALLKEQGYDVIGVSLKLWDYDEAERKLTGKTCCSLDDIADAKAVCDTLKIPFYAFNHKPEFRKNVIDVFVAEYARGRTPNPCVLCNRNIKFDVLLREAEKLGAAYLATGHYARVERSEDGVFHLLKGMDAAKDQSYVLFNLAQKELARVLFPIGGYTKAEIRALAQKYNLITHDKKESMEICFIPNNDHASFIAKNYPEQKRKPGNFIDENGTVLGEHRGIDAYTIGQRRGLNIALGERTYIKTIRPQTDEIVLASGDDVFCREVTADDFRFIRTVNGNTFGAKVRYQKDDIAAEIVHYDQAAGKLRLKFLEPARAVTPGQALVLYTGDEVIGGGWITTTEM